MLKRKNTILIKRKACSARIYITLPNIFEKDSHTDIYPTYLCRPPNLTPIYLAVQSRVGSSIQYYSVGQGRLVKKGSRGWGFNKGGRGKK